MEVTRRQVVAGLSAYGAVAVLGPANSASYLDILAEREGFGHDSIGGRDGPLFMVTSLADSGPGTLREALELENRWIRFASNMVGTIRVSSTMYMKDRQTIDGRGATVRIMGNGKNLGPLRIYNCRDVILINLNFDDGFSDWERDSEGADGITVSGTKNLWIHRCRFSRWSDGGLDLTGKRSENVSITRCTFEKLWQACALHAHKATVAHNRFTYCGGRAPKAITGFVHSYNNLVERWKNASIQGSSHKGQLLSEHNVFRPAPWTDGKIYNQVDSVDGKGRIYNKGHYVIGKVKFLGSKSSLDRSLTSQARSLARMKRAKTLWEDV